MTDDEITLKAAIIGLALADAIRALDDFRDNLYTHAIAIRDLLQPEIEEAASPPETN